MSNRVKANIDITSKKLWNTAIKEAERQLILAKRRVHGLEQTMRNWTRLRDEGMSWPGKVTPLQTQSGDHKSEAATQC
jgi:hypothetical protein